jgi:general stress protein CsbA
VDAQSCTVSLTIPGSSAVVALIYGNLSQAQNSQYLTYIAIAVVCLLAGGIVVYAYIRRKISGQGKVLR